MKPENPTAKTTPLGWAMTTLDHVRFDSKQGIDPSKFEHETFELYSVPSHEFLQPDIKNGAEIGSNKFRVEPSTVLLCKINPHINRVWVVGNHSIHSKIASTEWIPFFPSNEMVPVFLQYFLSKKQFRDFLSQNVSGVGGSLMRVKPSTLNGYPFPLPPLAEQHRIVAKIEELFSDLDAGIASLKKAKEQLKVYRKSVFQAGLEGVLTKEWRENNSIPTSSELKSYIQACRQSKLDEEANRAKSRGERAPKVPMVTQSGIESELSRAHKVPMGWASMPLGDMVWSVKDGPHFSPKYSAEGIPFISGGNIRPAGIDFSSSKYVSRELHEEFKKKCHAEKWDVLYTKGGTTGIARVNTYDVEFSVWVHVAVLKPVIGINPFYLQHALNSELCYLQAQKFTHGVGNQDLGLTRMVNIIVPICSEKEQMEVVKEIDYFISEVDNLDKTLDAALAQSESLRQSILKQAFEGKLVPQDPNDEPAEKLLERIRADRADSDEAPKKWQTTEERGRYGGGSPSETRSVAARPGTPVEGGAPKPRRGRQQGGKVTAAKRRG